LVTGCAGFVGSHLSEALLEQGNYVRGVDCFTDYYPRKTKLNNIARLRKDKAFELVEADLASSALSGIVADVDAVFHLAAQPGVRASWGKTFSHYVHDNIIATQKLLEALKGRPLERFVYASSSSIYGDAEKSPTPEDALPAPVSPYGATKLAGEHLCHVYSKNYALPLVVLRYFTVYGPRQRPDMAFSRFISAISSRRAIEVYGDGDQRRDFTFVNDIVSGNLLALRATPGSTYNVGAGMTHSVNEVIETIERLVREKSILRHLPAARGDVRVTSADISRISADLGYKVRTTLAEGLEAQVSSLAKKD
jgi:nucleoside-diphosphate-sugar epimerase